MPTPGSVTVWIEQLKSGDVAAASPLWQGYFRRLVGLARQRLGAAPRRVADEEDVALSAFASFCRAVAQGGFPRLDDRDDLWQVLFMLTARKAGRQIRHEQAAKRDWRKTRHASALEDAAAVEVPGREPTPEDAAQVADEVRLLLRGLDADQRVVAVAKMEGYSNAEIAALLSVTERTVERRLKVIRKLWKRKDQP